MYQSIKAIFFLKKISPCRELFNGKGHGLAQIADGFCLQDDEPEYGGFNEAVQVFTGGLDVERF